MSAVAFDTLKLVDALEQANIPREQARAIVDVVRQSRDSADFVTKKDLEIALSPLRVLQGVTLAGVGVVLVKLFFG